MKNKILIRNIYRLNLQIFLKKTNPAIFHKDTHFVKNKSNRQQTRYIDFIFQDKWESTKQLNTKQKRYITHKIIDVVLQRLW